MKSIENPENKATQEAHFTSLLRSNKLKVTQPRLRVLEIVSAKNSAISQPDLEKILGTEIDRVTLYRILANF
ncbi:Uncharacterised protein [Sphingobacterium spiritivorum]|nr:hypothetical protein [Sphingobacterium spiritivorum]SUJ22557.1 Uncharacterised protein [Sphingobacterium spiritivorum]